MRIDPLAISGILLITPQRFADARGWFSETWAQARYRDGGVEGDFVQDNHSYSAPIGTIRGLHCQLAPSAQGKLVRVVRGSVWDVAVDIRTGSPSYGQHVGANLSAENGAQLWIPPGFLHGFCTLEPDCELVYKCTGPYDRAAERGVRWDDPQLAIPWPVAPGQAVLSDKDQVLGGLESSQGWFSA